MPKELRKFKVNEIVPYPNNPKKHPPKQLLLLAKLIDKFGWYAPIVVDRYGVIIIGHGRLKAYLKYRDSMKLPEPEIRTSPLLGQDADLLRISDNSSAESEWDQDMLIAECRKLEKDLFGLTGFDDDLITESTVEDDDIPPIPVKPKSKLGEIYQLGNHYIMAGDSTSEKDVSELMLRGGGQKMSALWLR